MAKKAKKKVVRREWTRNDVRELKSLAKQKIGVKKIAKALKRTPGATAVKAAKLGVSLMIRSVLGQPVIRGFHLLSPLRGERNICDHYRFPMSPVKARDVYRLVLGAPK